MQTTAPTGLVDAIRAAGGLDRALRTGLLRREVELIAPDAAGIASGLERVPLDAWRDIPVINLVTAGELAEFTDLGYPARCADDYIRADIDDPDAFGARVCGDSMAPLFQAGDVVIFSPAVPAASGMDCFVRTEPYQESTFKRVFHETDADGSEHIRLQPLNGKYPAKRFPREQIAGLYPAVRLIRQLGA